MSAAVDAVLGGGPVEICAAARLPEGVSVDGIAVTPVEAEVRLGGTGLIRDRERRAATGSC